MRVRFIQTVLLTVHSVNVENDEVTEWEHAFRRGEVYQVGEYSTLRGSKSTAMEFEQLGGAAEVPDDCWAEDDSLRFLVDFSHQSRN